MQSNRNGLSVRILDKEFTLACPEGKEAELRESAQYLDQQMRKIRSSGRVVGLERIAIMAALNLSHDLLTLKNKLPGEEVDGLKSRLENLHHKIDSALSETQVNHDRMNNKLEDNASRYPQQHDLLDSIEQRAKEAQDEFEQALF